MPDTQQLNLPYKRAAKALRQDVPDACPKCGKALTVSEIFHDRCEGTWRGWPCNAKPSADPHANPRRRSR